MIMYNYTELAFKIFCIIIIILGIKGLFKQNKYKKDTETVKRIIEYFEKEGKDGIKDKTLIFKNQKYYINKK